jgi:hypothetical protein
MSDLNSNEAVNKTKDDQTMVPRHRKRLISVVLVGCNIVLLAGIGMAYTTTEQQPVNSVVQTIESVREGGALSAKIVQPSPFDDMVYTLGGLVAAGRLDERSAARLYALTLNAGRDALLATDEKAAIDAMVDMAGTLLEGSDAEVELSAFRQRHNPIGSQSYLERNKVQPPGDAEYNTFVQALSSGDGGDELWAAMAPLGRLVNGAQCEIISGEVTMEQTAVRDAGPEDLLFYAGGKGTPGLAGMWLQLSVTHLDASDEIVRAQTLAEYATRWYDVTISLAAAEFSGEPASQPAAAAWLWWGTTGSKLEGPMKVRPWSDLLLETPKVTTFASADALVRHAAAVGLRSGVDTNKSYTTGTQLGTCGAGIGVVSR